MEKIQMLSCHFQVFQLLVWEFYGEVSESDLETAWQDSQVAGVAPEAESNLAAYRILAAFFQGLGDRPSQAWASAQNR